MSTKTPGYESPNIVIVPTVSFINNKKSVNTEEPPPKKQKLEPSHQPSINTIPATSSNTPPVNANEETKKIDFNSIKKEIKVNSWASNYLNSIGINTKPIKMNLSISKNKQEKLTIAAENKHEGSNRTLKIDSKDNTCAIEEVNKINKTDCDASTSKPVEDNVCSTKNVAEIETILNRNNVTNISNTSQPNMTTEPAINIIQPNPNPDIYHQHIEPTHLNSFNTTNKRKYDEYLNPNYYNTNFRPNENIYASNYYEYTYDIIEKQLYEMEKGSQYLDQHSASASIDFSIPQSHDIFAKSNRDKDIYEPKSNIFDSEKKFKDKSIIPENNSRSRFDSDSSYLDAKTHEREKKSKKISSRNRIDSKSPYKKVNTSSRNHNDSKSSFKQVNVTSSHRSDLKSPYKQLNISPKQRNDSNSRLKKVNISPRHRRVSKSPYKQVNNSPRHRSDSKSPYKKVNKTTKPRYKDRSYSPNYDGTKKSERYSRSESYKRRDSAEPRTSKYDSEKYSKDKPESNYNKEKKLDKERYHEAEKKCYKNKEQRSRTPERGQKKRPRTDSESFDKKPTPKKMCSLKSVVQSNDNIQEKRSKSSSAEPFDLRSKLSRSNKYYENDIPSKSIDPVIEKIRDNLLVTINQTNNKQKAKAPSKIKITEKKSKRKKFKTIQFTIKVLCEEGDGSSSVSEDSAEEGNSGDEPGVQRDLSFLDDFNVDEIVDSLKHTRQSAQKGKKSLQIVEKTSKSVTNKKVENSNVILECSKTGDNIKAKEETVESKDCIILDESDVQIKKEQIDDYNNSNDCIILESFQTTINIKDEKNNMQNEACVSGILEATETKLTSSDKNNESNDCVIVDLIGTEKIEVKKENMNESNYCLTVEPEMETMKIETDSFNKNTSNDCIILDPDMTTEIKIEDTVEKEDTRNNTSDDCIIVNTEPIKIEPNINEFDSPALDSIEVIHSTPINNQEIKIKEEPQNKYVDKEITPATSDDVLNIPLPNTPINQKLTKVTVQTDSTVQKIQVPLTKEIKQEFIDENAPVAQNTDESNTLIELVHIPLPENTPSANNTNEHAESSNTANRKEVTLSDKGKLIDDDLFNLTSKNQNHDETVNDATYDSDVSTLKLQNDSDDEVNDVLKEMEDILIREEAAKGTKVIEKEEEITKEETKVIEVTVLMEDNEIYKDTNSSQFKTLDDKLSSTANTHDSEPTSPYKEIIIPKNTSTPKTPSETSIDVQRKQEIIAFKPELNKSNQNEEPKTDIAKSNKKEATKTEITKSNPQEASKADIGKSNSQETSKTDIPKSNQKGTNKTESTKSNEKDVPKTEITKSNQPEAPKTNIAKSDTKESPKTKTNTTNPKITTEEEKRHVTIVKKDKFYLSEFNELKQILEERMFEYLHDKYTIMSFIHKGRFSNIYRCHDSKKRNYVVKLIKDQVNRLSLGVEKENILQELQRDIPRENIRTVFMIDSFGVDRYWAFLMEFYPSNLKTILKRCTKSFSLSQVQDLAGQLLNALMVLRNNNIVHSDINPGHILINESRLKLKLCGFDRSYYNNQKNLLPNIGTLAYRAPEVIIGYSASFAIDVWSAAVVLFEMFTKRRLFSGVYNNQILFNQLCLFGNMPTDMIQQSVFKGNHFSGTVFMRRSGYHGMQTKLVHKFHKTPKFYRLLFSSYENFCGSVSVLQRANDLVKLYGFFRLLEQMLVIDPRRRLAVEFACTDPFITDMIYNSNA